MTERPTDPTDQDRLAQRVATLEAEREHARRFGVFDRLYPALAVVLAALTFLPVYDPLVHNDDGFTMRWSFGSIWQIVGDDRSGASVLGIVLFGVLALMLMIATCIPEVPAGLLVSSAVISVAIAAMILLKPAMPDPPPDIGYGGEAAIGVLVLIAASTVIHAWMLVHDRRAASSHG